MIDIAAILAAHMLIIILALIVSAIPLYLAIKFVKGEAGIVKIIMVGILLSFASVGAARFIGVFAGLFMLIGTLFVYQIAFKISLFRAFLAWVLQYLFVFIIVSISLFFVGLVL